MIIKNNTHKVLNMLSTIQNLAYKLSSCYKKSIPIGICFLFQSVFDHKLSLEKNCYAPMIILWCFTIWSCNLNPLFFWLYKCFSPHSLQLSFNVTCNSNCFFFYVCMYIYIFHYKWNPNKNVNILDHKNIIKSLTNKIQPSSK